VTDIDSSSDFTRPLSVERFEADRATALKRGFTIVDSDDYTLTLDLDGPEAGARLALVFERASELFGLTITERWPSKSGAAGHEHVVISVTDHGPLDATTRIAIQVILGSDPVRELLALKRLENGVAEPSQLFKPRRVDPFIAEHPEVFGS